MDAFSMPRKSPAVEPKTYATTILGGMLLANYYLKLEVLVQILRATMVSLKFLLSYILAFVPT
jgi:hypothetical protein